MLLPGGGWRNVGDVDPRDGVSPYSPIAASDAGNSFGAERTGGTKLGDALADSLVVLRMAPRPIEAHEGAAATSGARRDKLVSLASRLL